MKKEEKTRRTYEKILSAAIVEFGTKSYDKASLTTLCRENQIPKGLLYHNFKSKDDLYLQCVEICFRQLTDYLLLSQKNDNTVQGTLHTLLQQRHHFFQENPYYSNIFFNTVLQPPAHLQEEIKEIRREFDAFSLNCYKDIIDKIQLRDGITPDMAIQYFTIFQEMFNGYFQSKSYKNSDFHLLIRDHEINLSKILDIVLYGIANKDEQ